MNIYFCSKCGRKLKNNICEYCNIIGLKVFFFFTNFSLDDMQKNINLFGKEGTLEKIENFSNAVNRLKYRQLYYQLLNQIGENNE